MRSNLSNQVGRARKPGEGPSRAVRGAIAKWFLPVLAGCAIAACASRSQTAAPTAGSAGQPARVPEARAADSMAAGTLAVARTAQLSAEDLAALVPSPPRLLSGGILFTCAERSARSLFVAGTFNGWVPNQHELVRRGANDSLWVGFVPLPPRGRYVYKYLLDGRRWIVDPGNPDRSGDGAGGVASVVVVP